MYSKTLAVFLLVCVAQGLVNGSKLVKRHTEAQGHKEHLVESIMNQLVALLNRLTDEGLQAKSRACDPQKNVFQIIALQSIVCGVAFETYTSGSTCDGEIHNFEGNFVDFANFNAEFVTQLRLDEHSNSKIIDLNNSVILNYGKYSFCEGPKPKHHTSELLHLCNHGLEEILQTLDKEVEQCASTTTKTGVKSETNYELPQLMYIFHVYLNISASDVHSCPSVKGDLEHYLHLWTSLRKDIGALSAKQEDKSECKNSTEILELTSENVAWIIKQYIENHLSESERADWAIASKSLAIDVLININTALNSCPHAQEDIMKIINATQTEMMNIQEIIYEKVNKCRNKHQAQAAKLVRSITKRNVDCQELEKYLRDEINRFERIIATQIENKITDNDCKTSLIAGIGSIKYDIEKFIADKKYSKEAVEELIKAIKGKIDYIPSACQNKVDWKQLRELRDTIYDNYYQYLPRLEEILKNLRYCSKQA